jgi:hypothetical protein
MRPKEIDLGFKIDEEKVMALDLPVEEVDLTILMNNADICYLEKEGTDDWNLSPNQLVADFDHETTHARRVEDVDMYPIAIYWFKNNWIILDGVHRFTKALMRKAKTIKVKKVPAELIETLQ